MISQGDYLIIPITMGKNALVKATISSKDSKTCKGVLENADEEKKVAFDFKVKEVVANLGKSPKCGNVYGVNVEPLRERIDHPFWGEIQIYTELDEHQRKALRTGMKEVVEQLKKLNVPKLPLITQIKEAKGKMRGYYKHKPRADKDVLCAKVDEDLNELDYIFGHEYAHGLWARCMSPKAQMAWIKLYHDALTLKDVTAKELKEILEDLKSNGDVSSYMKECDEETLLILRAVFRYIKQVHSIEPRHFKLALMLGEDIDQYWPKAVELSEKKVLISEYAKKNPEELFAESFAMHFCGKKLPQRVADLLDKSRRNFKQA